MKKNKNKTKHSMISNIFYMLKLMFKISPALVVGEIAEHILKTLPGKLISVIGLKYIIDEVTNGGDVKNVVIGIAAILLILVVSEVGNSIFFELFVHKEREKLDLGIQSTLYKKAAQLDLSKYDDPGYYSDFILAVEMSSDNIKYILQNVKYYVGEIISFLTISAVLLTIDPVCLLIVLTSVAIFIPVGRYTGNLMNKRRTEITEKHRKGDYFSRLFYLRDYAGEIRTGGLFGLLDRRFSESADDIVSTQDKYVKKIDKIFFVQETSIQVIGFMVALTLYIGYRTLVTGDMTAGDFVATFNGAVQIGGGVLYLTVYGVRQFTERSGMIEKYRVFMAEQSRVLGGKTVVQSGKPEKITVKNISFSYTGSDEDALNGISFEIEPCEKIALVGYNGAGKTTLTNLLLRLYDVTDGSIEIGGTDIRDVTVESHRARFSAVFQDFQIFGATVGENVALEKDFDEQRVLDALRKAGFTKELPNGVNTVLLREFDDDGLMLSGGEQQKIAIARAFYKDCPYIILDEPSANLDPVSEYELNKAISRECDDRTVVFISHRLSTTRHADRILMLENGKIIESGSHDELMKKDGKYAYMFRLQAEKYEKTSE
ncbi:MAG: ABC transporter ATP-binding protein [Clostridia bacterium]|nr:ABC transporter ATP-binding protein [Clostridia bacterium]